MPLLHNYFMGR